MSCHPRLPMAKTTITLAILAVLTSCSSGKNLALPEKLKSVPTSTPASVDVPPADKAGISPQRFSQVPAPSQGPASLKSLENSVLFPPKEAPSISLSIDGMSLPAFINEVFANQLKLGFQMAPEVANKEDLVTLRITEPRNRQDIFQVARDVLANYGIQIVQEGDLLRFVLSGSQGAMVEPPLIVTGTALPSVPSTHRPIFLIRSLNVISPADAYSMLNLIFEGQNLKVQRDNARNAVTLRGTPDIIQSAAEALNVLDRPKMKGRNGLRIDPLFVDAESLSKRLIATMSAQGFDIGGPDNTITLIPVKELNALFVFAPDQTAINMVRNWTEQLDKVAQQSSANEGYYWYQVRNIGAGQLADTLNAITSGTTSSSDSSARTQEEKLPSSTGAATSKGASQRNQAAPLAKGSFVVDTSRNMLLFHGEANRWQELAPLIRELDNPPSQVLVEVVVAEVSRTDKLSLGTKWNWANSGIAGLADGVAAAAGSLGRQTIATNADGFAWTSLNSSGSTKLALNALASTQNMNVLQTPKVLVRSGETATVSVAEEIQIPSGTVSTGQSEGGTSVPLTQFRTRSTGIILSVKPTVFSDGRIDLVVSQEVSNVARGSGSATVVKSRNIETSLILNDGGSVLLAGLIDKKRDNENTRVPLLGSIPILGHLFKADDRSTATTELIVLIIPYLIKDHKQAEALTQSFKQQIHIEDSSADFKQNSSLKNVAE